ncbi:proline-rich protein 14 isoform X3 [Gopherus flavomarginatus]|uniref:proline-rich protein 14 isoform X3 n=1 Tax=Gopherus flavomarginatus TaxID=286002 RepID=UPI0021CBCF4C|nr:proline-rich protein 14 isoform X3 [Gopherus flavomarginatus]
MEHPMARGALAGGGTRLSASERNVRRQRLIVYRPSTAKQSSPAPQGPEEKAPPLYWLPQGRAGSPQARRQSERLQGRRQRLQQGVPQWGPGAELWLVASPMERARHRVSQRGTSPSAHPAIPSLPRHHLPGKALPPLESPPPGLDWTPRHQEPAVDRPSLKEHRSPVCQRPENKAPASYWPPQDTARSESERLQGKRWLVRQGAPQQSRGPAASPSISQQGKELVTSPMERAQQRVLTVALEECPMAADASLQQEDLLMPSPPNTVDKLTASSSDQWERCPQPADPVPEEAEPPGSLLPSSSSTWPPPICSLLRPQATVPPLRHWGITPLFQSVKSKLETFADIFLSPVKPRLRPPPSPHLGEGGEQPAEPPSPEEEPAQSRSGPSQQEAHSSRQGVNIEVKIAISQPAERRGPGEAKDDGEGDSIVSCRPPICQWRLSPEDPSQPRLGRSYSCPDFPWAMPSPLLASAPCPPRRRRHTVCSLEVSRELLRGHPSLPVLPCLRKEVFPFPSPASRRLLSPVVCMTRCDEARSSCPGPPHHEEPATALLCPRSSHCHPALPQHLGSRCHGIAWPTRQGPERFLVHMVFLPHRDGSQHPKQGERGHGVTTDGILLSHTDAKCSQEETTGKVSRFRIRKTPAKQQANLTPMGLPRPVRLDKKEFSLEEIYTNKNYRTPTEKRTFETIFEEPRERNGALVLTSQRKLKRTMEFQDSSLPRKQRRARPRGRLTGRAPGGRRAPPQHLDLEELLRQRLAELDALFEADED